MLVSLVSIVTPLMLLCYSTSFISNDKGHILLVSMLNWFQFYRHVAGLNLKHAKAIIEYRKTNGPIHCREQLKNIKGIGPKTFEQCAGFLRINPSKNSYNGIPDMQKVFISLEFTL